MADVDKNKAIGGGVKTGIALLALMAGRGGIQEATEGVMTILESTGVVEGGKGGKGKPAPSKTEEGPLTPEMKAQGEKIAKAAIARLNNSEGGKEG